MRDEDIEISELPVEVYNQYDGIMRTRLALTDTGSSGLNSGSTSTSPRDIHTSRYKTMTKLHVYIYSAAEKTLQKYDDILNR